MSRSLRRRALLCAALPAAVAACALPSAASAATVELSADGTLTHRGASGEINSLNVRMVGSSVEVKDFAGLTSRTNLCASVTSGTVRCAIGVVKRIDAQLGDRNDGTSIRTPLPVVVQGGSGDDSFNAGAGPDPSNVAYHGGFGTDVVTYRSADRGVVVNTTNFFTADGRRNFDRDNVFDDVEVVRGSAFDDELADFGHGSFVKLDGNEGNDVLRSGLEDHTTTFDMNAAADGADKVIAASPVFAFVDYSQRTRPVTVTLDHAGAADGEAGEGDEITGALTRVLSGQAGDTITAKPGSTNGVSFHGGPGGDKLEGAEGPDFLDGAAGTDTLIGNGGNDGIDASDGEFDIVGCGAGSADSASLDSNDVTSSCETRQVGVLRLTPESQRIEAGEAARLKLSWRHPKAWKQLRSVQLRLTRDGAPVGSLTIRPGRERVADDGAVRVNRARVVAKGKTLSANLAVRLDRSLAGRRLRLEVEAVDARGARQLERNTGSIRLAG